MLEFDIALEADELEALAHRIGQCQLLHFVAQAQFRRLVLRARLGFGLARLQTVDEQEAGLRAVAGQIESRVGARLGERG